MGIHRSRVSIPSQFVLAALALALLLLVLNAQSAQAATCRQIGDHQVCLLRIERSAKYFWEYRAALSIDGKARPPEKYDCRRRVRIGKDGRSVPFEPQDAGNLVCQLNKSLSR